MCFNHSTFSCFNYVTQIRRISLTSLGKSTLGHTLDCDVNSNTNARTQVPSEDPDNQANKDFEQSKLSGWRFAEKKFIASLLSMTNLVLHVKDLHLELAAAFQAITFDAFSDKPDHPLRRLLDPFIHRSVQATNDNFALLFQYKAAEFSLAPLP